MNIKWKIAIHIVATLLIGILIGALLNRTLVQRRIRNIMEMRTAGLLAPRPERDLKPVSPEQDKKIREILDKHAQRLAEIHKRFDAEIQASFKSLNEEINPILTPEQRDQLKRMIPGPPPFHDRGRPGFPPMRREGMPMPMFGPEVLQRELNLTEEQMAKIKAIMEEFRNQAPRPGERPEGPEFGDSRRQFMEKMDQEIEKILTDEQKEKFREFRKHRGPVPGEGEPPRPPSPL
jgi:Spy/CpxP family protein refolding chaperone